MIGHRVRPKEDGFLDQSAMSQPGAYGRVDVVRVLATMQARGYPIKADHPWCDWEVCAPDGHSGRLSPKIHTVVEHEDGTITVSPSIDFSKTTPGAFHGWLRRGVWTSC